MLSEDIRETSTDLASLPLRMNPRAVTGTLLRLLPGTTKTLVGDGVMEVRNDVVQTEVTEVWVKRQQEIQPKPRIEPVKETEPSVSRKEDAERREKRREGLTEEESRAVREVAEQTQAFLDDLNIRLDFEVYEETGDMIVRIFNRATEELVREIPPEDLLELHKKIVDLRGVLFDGKA
jgi:flagellar protein FlaG